jgi:hypothetical protein
VTGKHRQRPSGPRPVSASFRRAHAPLAVRDAERGGSDRSPRAITPLVPGRGPAARQPTRARHNPCGASGNDPKISRRRPREAPALARRSREAGWGAGAALLRHGDQASDSRGARHSLASNGGNVAAGAGETLAPRRVGVPGHGFELAARMDTRSGRLDAAASGANDAPAVSTGQQEPRAQGLVGLPRRAGATESRRRSVCVSVVPVPGPASLRCKRSPVHLDRMWGLRPRRFP